MPNWVRNRVSIFANTTEELNNVLNTILDDEGYVDFNKIIKQPDELNIEDNSDGSFGLSYINGTLSGSELKKFNEMPEDRKEVCINLGKQYLNNIEKYGYPTWYGWRYNNWDTKWNANNTNTFDNVIEFDTAWSAPFSIYEKLFEMFPNVDFEIMYADEDVGYNVGIIRFEDGNISYNQPEGGTKEALEIYHDVQGLEDVYVWDEETQSIKYVDEFEDEDEE
jgi:hypothetical protein